MLAVYLIVARVRRAWPFATAAFILVAALTRPALAAATWPSWQTSEITNVAGNPVFTVDGKPFFVYGAAFFYERTPRAQWRDDLLKYKRLGINTIDLYLIWNWHAMAPSTTSGERFDFTGSTNSRRDLVALFTIIHDLGFKVIVRPGPVIRNEWRNGGYPAWLLEQPEYNMPLRDVLEGRYPATATFQNAHADDAAAEWLANPTHLRESALWLRTVLREIEPWSSDVIAIALDDDQGAYIDNDTWPAPHWHAYMGWLRSTVQSVVGQRVPLFINTYQMKVTASAPVWAWGNWYQSDAYRIGDHDLAQLAFSTGLLQTQPGMPVMASEFQAGWLQGADEVAPRAAAPENTTLALHELLQNGAHGIVNFPVQDTLNPGGWEVPWANWFYAWDAALTLQGTDSPRFAPTAAFGDVVRTLGTTLATFHPRADVAIAWLTSAYDSSMMTNDRIGHLAALTIAAQQRCRALALTCRLVDLRYNSLEELRNAKYLVVPETGFSLPFQSEINAKLAALRDAGNVVVTDVDEAVARGARSSTGGITDAALLVSSDSGSGVLDIINPGTTPRTIPATNVMLRTSVAVPALTIPAGGACDIPLGMPMPSPTCTTPLATPAPPAVANTTDIPLTPTATVAHGPWKPVPHNSAIAYGDDTFDDGQTAFVLDNGLVRAIVSPDAGARAFVFQDLHTHRNFFTTVGALRDDVKSPATPSPRDYIARYTHPIASGTFNRMYKCSVMQSGARAVVRCTYDAPDLAPAPVHFEKTFTLEPGSASLAVDLRSSADAASISSVSDDSRLQVLLPNDPQTSSDEIPLIGYHLVTLRYPRQRTERIVFTLQGPMAGGSNRP